MCTLQMVPGQGRVQKDNFIRDKAITLLVTQPPQCIGSIAEQLERGKGIRKKRGKPRFLKLFTCKMVMLEDGTSRDIHWSECGPNL